MNLNQITIDVSDLDRSAAFYEALGMRRIVWSPPGYARYESPAGEATLSLHRVDTPAGEGAALYFEADDVDGRVDALKKAGLRFEEEPADRRWLWREAWTRDPDGRRVCVYRAGENRRNPPWRIDEEGARP